MLFLDFVQIIELVPDNGCHHTPVIGSQYLGNHQHEQWYHRGCGNIDKILTWPATFLKFVRSAYEAFRGPWSFSLILVVMFRETPLASMSSNTCLWLWALGKFQFFSLVSAVIAAYCYMNQIQYKKEPRNFKNIHLWDSTIFLILFYQQQVYLWCGPSIQHTWRVPDSYASTEAISSPPN